jgi:hypothetical protein
MPHDYHHCLQYCEWLLREHERDLGFLEHILWSDEAAFTHEGIFNSHNSNLWAQPNPHVTREWGHQVHWGINVVRTWRPCIMACNITGPEPSGLLLLATPERNCLQPTDIEGLTAKFHTAMVTIEAGIVQHVQASIP